MSNEQDDFNDTKGSSHSTNKRADRHLYLLAEFWG